MSNIDNLKSLADRFACYWCYDWGGGGRLLLDGQAYSIEEIECDLYEVKTSTWAIDLETANLELSKEIHRLTKGDLQLELIRGGMGDVAPGEYVDVEQCFYPLFSDNSGLLDAVPENVLTEAVEIYCKEKDCLADYFTEDDPFQFVLPGGLHPAVHDVLQRLCRREAKKLRAEADAHEREIRRFDLTIQMNAPVVVKSGQFVKAVSGLMGQGIAVLNGMPQDRSAGSHVKASSFKKWIESQVAGGRLVFPVKGVFAGNAVDGVLAVAVFNISRNEAEAAVQSTSIGFGVFIDDDFMPKFIRR